MNIQNDPFLCIRIYNGEEVPAIISVGQDTGMVAVCILLELETSTLTAPNWLILNVASRNLAYIPPQTTGFICSTVYTINIRFKFFPATRGGHFCKKVYPGCHIPY